jgi:competence protein ComEA
VATGAAGAADARGRVSGAARAPETQGAPAPAPLFVHVLGAVRTPGLFQVHDGARVVDAVAAAGGFADDANQGGVNLARVIADGEQIVVPRVGEDLPPPASGAASGGAAGTATGAGGVTPTTPVNINTATTAELERLPRIGPAMAQRIVDWRTTNGRFTSVDDLLSVTGIGQKTLDEFKDLVRL